MEKNTMEMSKTTYIPNIPTYSGGPSAPGFVEPQRPMGFEEPQRPPGFSEPRNPPGFNVSPHQPAYGNPPPYSETQPSQPPRPAPTVIPARTTVITTVQQTSSDYSGKSNHCKDTPVRRLFVFIFVNAGAVFVFHTAWTVARRPSIIVRNVKPIWDPVHSFYISSKEIYKPLN
ncbi:unnamed protein product [Leptosia nina]|uniref:Uncharacterized protein n=1 Tax=Leptosia nina TaxID=320188 RepID=A0AAV1JSG3_9NEOP